MPTYTAVAFDRLIEPRASKRMAVGTNIPVAKLDRRNSTPASTLDRMNGASHASSTPDRGVSVPIPKPQRRNSATAIDMKHNLAGISPALYATPESTPLPDSPSSFPPSPYIVNHKRRGPRLLKSYSEDDVATRQRAQDEEKVAKIVKNAKVEAVDLGKDVGLSNTVPNWVEEQTVDVVRDGELGSTVKEDYVNGVHDGEGECDSNELSNGLAGHHSPTKSVTFNMERAGEPDDFFDPQDSMSVKSNTEVESNSGMDRSLNLATPSAEFYDAWEELSSESGPQPQPPPYDIEGELQEIRLSLLMEIEKRKQAEEALDNMLSQWPKIREELSSVGLTLPADPIALMKDEQEADPAEDLCRQIHLTRFVSNSIGRGTAKAEVEEEMEAQMELKNFEIARLVDRLRYYEAVNQEMSQRNQETVEVARRLRQKRKRRQRWVWGSIAAAITLGGAALAWSYLPSGKVSSSTGYVAVVGLPNVGKSTLSNQMIGQKLSIVTDKPQTTRHRILGICSTPEYQMILYDTPGVIEKEMHKLDSMMMKNVRTAAINADCVLLVVDACKMPKNIDDLLPAGMGESKNIVPVLLVLNKKDLIKPGEVKKKLEWYEKFTNVDEVIPVSAKYGHGVDDVKDWILSKLPLGPAYYPKDITSEHPERFFVGEIVREKIFMQYRNEVPYACQVNVVTYKARRGAKEFIKVEVVVEKNTQKIIIIGKDGKSLKLLATAARLDIEDFLQKKVYLEVEVKVKEKWRQDEGLLNYYGYGGKIRVF